MKNQKDPSNNWYHEPIYSRIKLTGLVFGRWTVLGAAPKKKTKLGCAYWKCKCQCGSTDWVVGYHLTSGKSKGCSRCRGEGRTPVHPVNPIFSHLPCNAKKRGIQFTITKDYAWSIFLKQNKQCALTGLPLTIAYKYKLGYNSACTASLDRINSDIGYIPGNVQWVYKPINNMKWSLDQNEFIALCKLVAKKNK